MSNTPLSDQELEFLEAYLANGADAGNRMPLDMVHGYLTTALSGPAPITPDDWLPQVLGDLGRVDQVQTAQVVDLLIRLFNSILDELSEGHYNPLLVYFSEGVDDPLPLPYGWCEGYFKGWELHGEDALNQMLQDEQAELMLAPIMVFLMYADDQLLNPQDEQMHRETVDELPGSVQGIYAWWLERRGNSALDLQ